MCRIFTIQVLGLLSLLLGGCNSQNSVSIIVQLKPNWFAAIAESGGGHGERRRRSAKRIGCELANWHRQGGTNQPGGRQPAD